MDDCEVKMFKALKEADGKQANIAVPLEMFKYCGHQCIILEHYEMDLSVFVNKFGPMQMNHLLSLACQMLQALAKLKELNIVHGDLKPGNIMMVNCLDKREQFKLIDFGLVVQLRNQESLYGYLQTSYYRAPEMIVGLPIAKSIDTMWSLGCSIGELAIGRPIFPGK
ncbi:hypothetical protein ACOME3_006607 [Neoechinorhynchus agilis]